MMKETQQYESTPLEPRVAKLEVGLDRLTNDVQSLAVIVREQGRQTEGEIQKLVVAVTQASGPRKTDWSVIISAVLLVMAIGSAVFWPLNQTSQENKSEVAKLQQYFDDHSKLELHPVGSMLVKRIESQMDDHVKQNERIIDTLNKKIETDFDVVAKNQKDNTTLLNSQFEFALSQKELLLKSEIKNLNDRLDFYIERLFNEISKQEDFTNKQKNKEYEELIKWRQKAMGLSSPSDTVPLISRDESPKK